MTPAPPSLETLGGKESLFGSRFVGLMRAVAATGAAATAMGATALGLAHLESRFPVIRRVDIPVSHKAFGGAREFRILHISDLHMFEGQDFITRFLAKVAEEEQFDFVVSTGDNLSDDSGVTLLLEALAPLLDYPGAFVLGSNDYHAPRRKPWTAYLQTNHHQEAAQTVGTTSELPWFEVVQSMVAAGWLDMSNRAATEAVSAPGGAATLSLVGVDDPHILRDHFPEPEASWQEGSALRLALSHAPYERVLNQATELGSDLILAGHTHGGQIRVPGVGALVNNTDVPGEYSRGLYKWHCDGKTSWLNISAGLGTSRYAQIRLFCRPEVSILRLFPV